MQAAIRFHRVTQSVAKRLWPVCVLIRSLPEFRLLLFFCCDFYCLCTRLVEIELDENSMLFGPGSKQILNDVRIVASCACAEGADDDRLL